MSRLLILSPGHPHAAGGVTDHTSRLVRSWTRAGHEVLVLSDPTTDPPPAQALLIQYVPFLYGRRGLSGAPERIGRAVRRSGGRVVVFVHEPWVPMTRLPWLVLHPLQKRQLRRLAAVADATVTAVPAWKSMLGDATELIYVGSTLGDPPALAAPLAGPALFSPFAAGLDWRWVMAAVERIAATPRLVVLGADEQALATHPATRRLDRAGWEVRGRLDPQVTLAALGAARLVLAPFVDGLSGRRTSACAALSVGARLVTSDGPLADPALLQGAAAVAGDREGFARAAHALWSQPDDEAQRARRLDWYRRHLDPTLLDRRLLGLLIEGR